MISFVRKREREREMRKEKGIKTLWRMSVFIPEEEGCEGI